MERDFLTRAHAGARAVTFNPRTTVLGLRIDSGIRKHPIARAGALVFFLDEVRSGAGDRGWFRLFCWSGTASYCKRAGSEHSLEQIAARKRIRAHSKQLPFAARNE